MTYAPGYREVVPPMVGPYTFGWSNYAHERGLNAVAASGTFEATNRAIYMPVLVPTTCVIRRLWWANGSTVSASYNIDCGIYADAGYKPGNLLISSGQTAQGTASQVQFVEVTDTTLPPGRYWVAIAASTSSATVFRQSLAVINIDAAFRFQQASAIPLPATATPVETSSSNFYLCGFATTSAP